MAKRFYKAAALSLLLGLSAASHAGTTIYSQDFENPVGFSSVGSGYKDVSGQSVNTLYGNQPTGFLFTQLNTVETIKLTGGTALGSGYVDAGGRGGNYSVGMLETVNDDRLSLSFDIGTFDFLNFQLDISRLGLDGPGGPFANGAPSFRFRLYDNPTGAANIQGNSTLLSFADVTGLNSVNNYTTNWKTVVAALDASASTNGKVTLQIDLTAGGYAVMDNFLIVASNTSGDVTVTSVPEPESWAMMVCGLAGLGIVSRRKRNSAAAKRT